MVEGAVRRISNAGIFADIVFIFQTVMKLKLILAGCFGLALLLPCAVAAGMEASPTATSPAAVGKVGQQLSTLPFLNGHRPNTHARYYIYLCSAGWCGPCNKAMPHVVETYARMQPAGLVELVHVNFDRSEEKALSFLARHRVSFPALSETHGEKLPGFIRPRGIPQAIIVDANGRVIKSGHGAIILDYEKIIDDYEQREKLHRSFRCAKGGQPAAHAE